VQYRYSGLLRYAVVSFGERSPAFRLIASIYETSGITQPKTQGQIPEDPIRRKTALSTSCLPRLQSAITAHNDRSQACSCRHVIHLEICSVQEIRPFVRGCFANAASGTETCSAEPTCTAFCCTVISTHSEQLEGKLDNASFFVSARCNAIRTVHSALRQ
jgi:hypothetical protein